MKNEKNALWTIVVILTIVNIVILAGHCASYCTNYIHKNEVEQDKQDINTPQDKTDKNPSIDFYFYENAGILSILESNLLSGKLAIPYVEKIIYYSKKHNVPIILIFGIIETESRFNPRAVNRYNSNGSIDYGLMQLNSASFPEYSPRELMNIDINLDLGIGYLRKLYNRFNCWAKTVLAYNAGPTRVSQNRIPFRVYDYYDKVLTHSIYWKEKIFNAAVIQLALINL